VETLAIRLATGATWTPLDYFAPVLNYAVMLLLALRGSHPRPEQAPEARAEADASFDAARVAAGATVGAMRRCEFSTGAFFEPITAWEPPARLAFDVRAQPLPMEEWSFYAKLRPPHLERSFRSLRGEFRLVALPGGRTRLEGRTWYALELAPAPYWRAWCDWIVHRIHARVLAHIARESTGGPSGARD
jgi:hypothetical protein